VTAVIAAVCNVGRSCAAGHLVRQTYRQTVGEGCGTKITGTGLGSYKKSLVPAT
jgi:hypothetical protein